MIKHKKESANENRFNLLKKGKKLMDRDGLNNLK